MPDSTPMSSPRPASLQRHASPAAAVVATAASLDTAGVVRRFISAVSKTIPAAISTAPAPRSKDKPRPPATEDGLP
jgi:hypothetical protein